MGAHQYGPLWEPTEAGEPPSSGEPPHLLPGPTAWYWQRRATYSLIIAVASIVGGPIGISLGAPLHEVVLSVSVAALVGFGLYSLRAAVGSYRAIHREQRAGYTTLFGEEFHHLWHLNPKTGEVIRPPDAAE